MHQGRRRVSGFAIALAISFGVVMLSIRVLGMQRASRNHRAVREIGDTRDRMLAALGSGDASPYIRAFASDGLALTSSGNVLDGARAIDAGMARTLERGAFTDVRLDSTCRTIGDVVVERGAYAFGYARERGEVRRRSGAFVAIWKRERGRWKIAFEDARSPVQ